MQGVTTFGAFTMARLGIYAAQKALDVTGHNISNINTVGYTRQVLDQMSLRTGGGDSGAPIFGAAMGSGVLVTGVSQLRDPYLDIRFRAENASAGSLEARLNGLDELSRIIDEVAKGEDENGLLLGQLNDLVSTLTALQKDQATTDEALGAVRTSAETLVRLLNSYSQKLDTVKENQEQALQQNVDKVNDILKQIQNLNQNIQKSEVYGDNALEMRDQRNLLLDELSGYIKIDVTYEPVSIGAGDTVDKLVVKSAGDPKRTLVDGGYVGQLTLGDAKVKNPAYDAADPTTFQYLKPDGTGTNNIDDAEVIHYAVGLSELTDARGDVLAGSAAADTFGDTELYGALQAGRELLTERGEFASKAEAVADPDAATKRGIPYYQSALDALARKFATAMNEANTGYMRNGDGNYVDGDGKEILTTGGDPISYQRPLDDALTAYLEAKGAIKLGGTLFSNSSTGDSVTGADGNVNITAANISISKSWSTGKVQIQNSMVMAYDGSGGPPHVGSSADENIVHLILTLTGDQAYLPKEMNGDAVDPDQKYFEGGFQDFVLGMQGTLGKDVRHTSTLLNEAYATATTLDVSRESVAGVDLNDEAMSMMKYQKSYSAACRMMTTIDEVLDKLINGTGIVGR